MSSTFELTRYPEALLRPDPENSWEAGSVFNPSVIQVGDRFVMLYRATKGTDRSDAQNYVSSIGYAESCDGKRWEGRRQLIEPDQPYEEGGGCEDPRVTRIGDTYYIYYSAVRRVGKEMSVRVALATTKDFQSIIKHGIVGPSGAHSKAACVLPEVVDGSYWFLYTWKADSPLSSIMSVRLKSLEEVLAPPPELIGDSLARYDACRVLPLGRGGRDFDAEGRPHGPKYGPERGPELGAVPIRTPRGWLFIYCRANFKSFEQEEWPISACLLDAQNPSKVIADSPGPILWPKLETELKGVVGNVTFPSGAVVVGDELYVYYGAGDGECRLATCKLQDLLEYLDENRL